MQLAGGASSGGLRGHRGCHAAAATAALDKRVTLNNLHHNPEQRSVSRIWKDDVPAALPAPIRTFSAQEGNLCAPRRLMMGLQPSESNL
jgi:hypothetical protein